MKPIYCKLAGLAFFVAIIGSGGGIGTAAQTSPEIPPALVTPDKVDTRVGPLEFKNGAPSSETVQKIYDNLDFTHAFEAFVNTMQGVSINAIHDGFLSA